MLRQQGRDAVQTPTSTSHTLEASTLAPGSSSQKILKAEARNMKRSRTMTTEEESQLHSKRARAGMPVGQASFASQSDGGSSSTAYMAPPSSTLDFASQSRSLPHSSTSPEYDLALTGARPSGRLRGLSRPASIGQRGRIDSRSSAGL